MGVSVSNMGYSVSKGAQNQGDNGAAFTHQDAVEETKVDTHAYTHRHTHLCVYTLKGVDLLHCTGGRQAYTKTVVQEPRDINRGKNTRVELDIIYSLHFRRPTFSG